VPFVDGDDQRPAALDDVTQQAGVLLADALVGIEHQQYHVRRLDGLEGLDDAELLYGLVDPAVPSHAGGVDQHVGLPVAAERHQDAVARGAGLVIGEHALFAEYPVDERGFADVGAPDDRDTDTLARIAGNI